MNVLQLYRLRLAEAIQAGDTTPMMVFPIGEWHSAKYPSLPLTEDLANELIANFEAGVLGTEPVVDSSGKHDTSAPAAGWVKRVYLASYEEGSVTGLALWADVKWTTLGAELLTSEQYKYGSVEIGSVVLNDSGETVDNVLRSLTLTNTPVLRLMPGVQNAAEKQRAVVTLSLSECTLAEDEPDPVSEILDDMDALAAKVDAAMKGKKGMPSVRTMMREARAKLSAYKMAEAVTKSESDAGEFPAAAYAYAPDPEAPSTWKLRLWATPDGGPDAGMVGAAIAALGKGYRGNKVEIPAADMAAVKAKVRAAWAKANPDKDSKEIPAVIKAAESFNDLRDALEMAIGDLYGERIWVCDFGPEWVVYEQGGMDDVAHTYKATYAKTDSGITLGQPVEVKRETTYVPVSDGAPGAGPDSRSPADAFGMAAEGTPAALTEDRAAQRGVEHHMDPKTLQTLQLAEGADDAAIDAAVLALSEDRDAQKARADGFETKLAEQEKSAAVTAFTTKLDEKISGGFIASGEREYFLAKAEKDVATASEDVEHRTVKVIDLGERGSSTEGSGQYADASVELDEKAKARAKADKIKLAEAQKLVLAEDKDLAARYSEFRMNPRKEA